MEPATPVSQSNKKMWLSQYLSLSLTPALCICVSVCVCVAYIIDGSRIESQCVCKLAKMRLSRKEITKKETPMIPSQTSIS